MRTQSICELEYREAVGWVPVRAGWRRAGLLALGVLAGGAFVLVLSLPWLMR